MIWKLKLIHRALTSSYQEFHTKPYNARYIREIDSLLNPLDAESIDYSVHVGLHDKYVFVETPKVACSSIKLSLINLERRSMDQMLPPEDFVHDRARYPLLQPSMVPGFDLILKSKDFYKFCFVRNPYTRLLSGYLDKVLGNYPEKRSILIQLGYNRFKIDRFISFEEFVDAVCEQSIGDHDPHWREQYTHCYMGRFDYHFVGHLETMKADLAASFDQIIPGGSRFITRCDRHKTSATGKMTEYYTPEILKKVNEKYQRDFEAFGYPVLEELPEDLAELKRLLKTKRTSGPWPAN